MGTAVALVHLVREVNGLEPFAEFLDSYERWDSGLEHELVLLFKGFGSREQLTSYRRRAAAHAPVELHVSDEGLDIGAYVAAARRLSHQRLCFTNSWTQVLASGWLGQLSRALDLPRAGMAGATGSWASHRSAWLARLGLPNGYGGTLGDQRPMVDAMRSVDRDPMPSLPRRLAALARGVPVALLAHPPFPAPHLRLTAFVVERELLLSLDHGRPSTKVATYRTESGHGSWTTQLLRRGLQPLLVGRNTGPLAPAQWPDADVFWQGAQRDLLVADRKTVAYARASTAAREGFARYAWGSRARPS